MAKIYENNDIYPAEDDTTMISELVDRNYLVSQFHTPNGDVYTLNRVVTAKTRRISRGHITLTRPNGKVVVIPDTSFSYDRATFYMKSLHGCFDHAGKLYIVVCDDLTSSATLTRYNPSGNDYTVDTSLQIPSMRQCLVTPTVGIHDRHPTPNLMVIGLDDRKKRLVWRHLDIDNGMELGTTYQYTRDIPAGTKLSKVGFADREYESALRIGVLTLVRR